MLTLYLARYWWVRPKVPDPLDMKRHDPLKSKIISSVMEPYDGPQLEKQEDWVQIPPSVAGNDPVQRSVIEIEKAIAEGKSMILVEPEIAGQVYYHYMGHAWLLQENTIFYGGLSLACSYLFPKKWWIYVPCCIISLLHSWLYFRVYKYDRLSQYQPYDDDRHPVSNLITAWVLGQRPDHFQYILKKESSIYWELISETVLYTSVISTLVGLMRIEEYIGGGRYTTSYQEPTYLVRGLYAPAYDSGYFMPAELVPVAPGHLLPSDIPKVTGWFDLPYFNFYLKPMKADLAVIICIIGGYFTYKAFEHFFGYDGKEDDGFGREWSGTEKNEAAAKNKPTNPYWVEIHANQDNHAILLGEHIATHQGNDVITEEQTEITRIANQEPFGWVRPGYKENHYGIFV